MRTDSRIEAANAATEPPRPSGNEELPSIAVVIPVLNEERYIADTLSQLAAQDYPPELMQILVVDGGSTDATPTRVREFIAASGLNVALLQNPNRLSSFARNIGIRHSVSDYVLFIDAHVFIPSRCLIREMAIAAREQGALVLGRAQPLDSPGLNVTQTAIAGVRATPLAHSRESYIYSRFEGWVSPLSIGVMYCRSIFERFGLFDESFDAAEDLEFNYRLEKAGIEALISPRFTVRYFPRRDLSGLFGQMQRYGRGRVDFMRKHPERFRLETFVPCMTSLSLLMFPWLLVPFEGLRLVLTGLAVVMVFLVMLLAFYHIERRHSPAVLMAPVCLCVIHLGLAWGVLKGVASGGPLPIEREAGPEASL